VDLEALLQRVDVVPGKELFAPDKARGSSGSLRAHHREEVVHLAVDSENAQRDFRLRIA
jgi:hypothetical protein